MSERLLLQLGTSPDQPIHWLHWDDSHQRALDQGQLDGAAQLSQLTALAIRTPSYALVSNSAVLTTEVQLPNDSRAARDAIPYQLEEQLCEEIESLHFATGAAIEPGRYPVAVVARPLMDSWQQWLIDAGLPIQALIVDAQSLATEAGQPRVISSLDQTLIRQSQGQSFSFPSAQAEQWLTLAEDQLGQTISPLPDSNNSLCSLAACFAPDTAIDLLQGQYKLKDPVKQMLRAWKFPALLLVLIMLLQGGQLLWQNHQLTQQKQQLDQQITQLFETTLPGSRRVNPKIQIEAELNRLAQRGQGSDFLRILQRALPAFNSSQGLKIQNALYQADQQTLTLELEAPSHAALEGFVEQLGLQGLQAQIQRSRQQNGQVSGQLTIKGDL
ncbi:MAG: type II secretion system protein GspL [Halopseudomonas sp.]